MNALESAEKRLEIARKAIEKMGARRAAQGLQPAHPPEAPKWGFEGVDKPYRGVDKFRARIRFCEASTGKDIRISSYGYADPAEAGYWYICAHIQAWGALSRYCNEIDPEVLEFIEGSKDTAVRDNLKALTV